MNFINDFQDKGKAILIPLLQRNYVQGGNAEIITNFLDTLLKGDCHLNYIYGYDERNGFVAIDGQQRLITLWLFHLYLYACKGKSGEFRVPLRFMGREYATKFCSRLPEKLGDVLAVLAADHKRGDAECLYKGSLRAAIEDQPWFIGSWKESATVRNMLATLHHLHRKWSPERQAQTWEQITSACRSITYAYLNMGADNGLDDEIYVKMNGRGRPLSRFENLKAFMDKKVAALPLKDVWRSQMDNAWTDLLWKNRDEQKTHPEELDSEFMLCFCNLLTLYHAKHHAQLEEKVKALDNYRYEELYALLGCNHDKPLNAARVVESIHYGNLLPFSWIETLNLMPADFFMQAMTWLNRLCAVGEETNNLNLFLEENKKTNIYNLVMNYGSFGNTLPKLYAAVSYCSEQYTVATSFGDWMRVTRNLIQNTSINYERLQRVLADIDSLCEVAMNDNIYHYLAHAECAALPNFAGAQVREEVAKAKFSLYADGELNFDRFKRLSKAENYAFFRGSVRFLLRNAAGEYSTTEEEFIEKYNHAIRYFDVDGVEKEYATDARLLRRLITHFSEDVEIHTYPIKYDKRKSDSWRETLLSDRLCAPVHALLMTDDAQTYNFATHTFSEKLIREDRYARTALVHTPMLNEIVECCEMRWRGDLSGGSFTLFPAGAKASWKFYILDPRIELLFADPERITFYDKNQKNCSNIRLLFGKYNWFWYREHLFCWDVCCYHNVYLADWDKKTVEKAIRNKDAKAETERWYCLHIDTKEITADNLEKHKADFYADLDALIATYRAEHP